MSSEKTFSVVCAGINLKSAERLKRFIVNNNFINRNFRFVKIDNLIFFPLIDSIDTRKIINDTFKDVVFETKELKKTKLTINLKDSLKSVLSKDEIQKLKTSYDVVGDIAILEVDNDLIQKEKLIANTLLEKNKSIKTILKKTGKHEGVFRTQKLGFIAGENKRETIYKENNVKLMLDVENVYFSERLSSERKRIMLQIKKNEDVLVMFSGCGPYVCVIAKNTSAKKVVGIEINPIAHKYAVKNVELNRLNNPKKLTKLKAQLKQKKVELYNGDVKIIVGTDIVDKFDRIIMPLPMNADDFLDSAFKVAKKGTIVHLYDFLFEKEIPSKTVEKIKVKAEKNNIDFEVLGFVKCGQFSPRKYRVCVDFKII